MGHVFSKKSAAVTGITDLWTVLSADEQDKPADERPRLPVGRASGPKPRRRRGHRASAQHHALNGLDRGFAKRALNAVALDEDYPVTNVEVDEQEWIAETIDATRARQTDLDAHLTDLDMEAQEARRGAQSTGISAAAAPGS